MNFIKLTFGIFIASIIFFGVQNIVITAQESGLEAEINIVDSVGGDILLVLLELRNLVLKGDIFTDKTFTSLKDFGTEIRPQPVGRTNPFARVNNNEIYFQENDTSSQGSIDSELEKRKILEGSGN